MLEHDAAGPSSVFWASVGGIVPDLGWPRLEFLFSVGPLGSGIFWNVGTLRRQMASNL
jgi:hypothetical protein